MFLTREPISVTDFLSREADDSCGAVVSFVGVVRKQNEGKQVKRLYYECYDSMANQEMGRIIDEIKNKHAVNEIHLLHRIGWLEVGEAAVAIWVSAAHREEAFVACRAVIDAVKARVPIWKKEVYADGTSEWIICPHAVEV